MTVERCEHSENVLRMQKSSDVTFSINSLTPFISMVTGMTVAKTVLIFRANYPPTWIKFKYIFCVTLKTVCLGPDCNTLTLCLESYIASWLMAERVKFGHFDWSAIMFLYNKQWALNWALWDTRSEAGSRAESISKSNRLFYGWDGISKERGTVSDVRTKRASCARSADKNQVRTQGWT